jgi:hypothetical protein
MGGVFIISRRSDSEGLTGLLIDRLVDRFGADRVYCDIDTIKPGAIFIDELNRALDASSVMIAVIGTSWLSATDATGRRRLDDSDDVIRLEIRTALERGIPVIPVLVQDTVMPAEADLPVDLKPLARRNAVALRASREEEDLAHLLDLVEQTLHLPPCWQPPPAPVPERSPVRAGRGLLGRIGELFRSMGRPVRSNGGDEGVRRGQRAKPPLREEPEEGTVSFPMPASALSPAGAESPTAGVPPEPEPVLLGAAAPRVVKPGDEFTARFVAYVKAVEEEVREMLEKLSTRSEAVLGVQECRWQMGTPVTMRLSGRGLAIDPPEQTFVWKGNRNLLEFDVAVPADAADGTVVLKFDVLIDGIVVARLRLDVAISSRAGIAAQATVVAEPAHTAFASYSLVDRDRVLDRVAAVRIAAGLDIFLDCLDLRPSEEWKPQLDAEIRGRDLFLLFWSAHAKESKWVTWEWQTALHDKGKEQMQIHPLEPNVKPPEELADLHFGDVYMWVRTGYEATRPPSAGT